MRTMCSTFLRAAVFLLLFTLVTGILYPLAVTGISQMVFPHQANGSLIEMDGRVVGSELLGQPFSDPKHLWGRPMKLDTTSFSDAEGQPTLYAWPSNLSPASDEYEEIVAARVALLHAADPTKAGEPIPVDLVTISGSGLDPHISPAAADYQVHRIAQVRDIPEEEVRTAIRRSTTGRFLGVLGEPRVNVLQVNLLLDGLLEEE